MSRKIHAQNSEDIVYHVLYPGDPKHCIDVPTFGLQDLCAVVNVCRRLQYPLFEIHLHVMETT